MRSQRLSRSLLTADRSEQTVLKLSWSEEQLTRALMSGTRPVTGKLLAPVMSEGRGRLVNLLL